MRLFYGPTDVLHAATTLTNGATRAMEEVVDLVELAGRASSLMARAETLLAGAEESLQRADAALDHAEASLTRADQLLDRTNEILTPVWALTDDLVPKATRISQSIDPESVVATQAFIGRVPELVAHVEEDLLPMLGQLDRVGPDVHDILVAVTELSQAMRGLPGMGLLQRRAERKEREEDHEHDHLDDTEGPREITG